MWSIASNWQENSAKSYCHFLRRNVGESRRSIHLPGIVKHTKRDAPEDLKSGKRRAEKNGNPETEFTSTT
jgi:hypothetical protein